MLADALALADEEKPDLLIDLGTLTRRGARGPRAPSCRPFYTNDETAGGGRRRDTRVRRTIRCGGLPMWAALLTRGSIPRSPNVNNAPSARFCGLHHLRSVPQALCRIRRQSWLHVDIYGWTPSAKPARPEGGECQAARAIYKLLSERYG